MHREARRSTRKRSHQVRDVEVENPISTSSKIQIKVASVECENCGCINAIPEDFRVFITICAEISVYNSSNGGYAKVAN